MTTDGGDTPPPSRLVRTLFGDRLGLVVFLGALAFAFGTWRIGFFITDNWTVANAFVSLAEGSLHVDRLQYGPDHGATPGMHVVDNQLYARNFGHLVLALPLLWALRGVATVADPALALAGAFSLLVLGLFVQVGRLLDRETALTYAGAGVALVVFGVNAAVAVELRPYWVPFAALQLSTMVAAGLTVVAVYRVLRRLYGRRIGAVGGAALALSSPVAFWATIPKRHALSALFVVASLLWFYRSREARSRRSRTRYHALAYVPVGLLAWVHAAEGLALLGALLVADLVTLRRVDSRRVGVVAGALLASLGPFVLTNWLISGDPLTPPRMLPNYWRNVDVELAVARAAAPGVPGPGGAPLAHAWLPTTPTPAPGGGGGGGSGSLLAAAVAWLTGLVDAVVARVELFLALAGESVDAATDGDRLSHVFVRSGYLEGVAGDDNQRAVRLSVLESMPLLGGLVAVPVAVARGAARRRSRSADPRPAIRGDPAAAAHVLVACVTVAFLGLYLSRLPVPASWTVRYLHPLYPLGLVALLGLPAIRETIDREWPVLAWTYAGAVLVGGQVLVIALAVLEPTLGEAVQLHALLAVGAGSATAAWTVVATVARGRLSSRGETRLRRTGAVVLAVAAAATTVMLVLWAVAYYPHSEFALPAVGELSELLPFPV